MAQKEVFEKLLQFERENTVFSKTVNGVHYWDRIRGNLMAEINERIEYISTDRYIQTSDQETINIKNLGKGAELAINAMWTLTSSPFLAGKSQVLFKATNTSRRENINGVYWDMVVDPLSEYLDCSSVSFENQRAIRKYCDGPIRTRDTVHTDLIKLIEKVGTRILDPPTIDQESKKEIEHLETELNSIFGTDVDLLRRVYSDLNTRRILKPLYQKALSRIDPKAVLIRYNPGKATLIEVCNEMSIPVVELQHGVLHGPVAELSYPDEIEGQLTFPDTFFAWGEYWVDKPNFPIDDVRVVGWPYIDAMVEKYPPQQDPNSVLFISQPFASSMLSDFALWLSAETEFDVVYRLHPRERENWRSLYPQLVTSSVDVDTGEDPLYQSLAESYAQVGTNSTVLYEGLVYQPRTLVYDDFDEETHPWRELDSITVFQDEEQLLAGLDDPSPPSINLERFFEPNSIRNINDELKDIIRGSN